MKKEYKKRNVMITVGTMYVSEDDGFTTDKKSAMIFETEEQAREFAAKHNISNVSTYSEL